EQRPVRKRGLCAQRLFVQQGRRCRGLRPRLSYATVRPRVTRACESQLTGAVARYTTVNPAISSHRSFTPSTTTSPTSTSSGTTARRLIRIFLNENIGTRLIIHNAISS